MHLPIFVSVVIALFAAKAATVPVSDSGSNECLINCQQNWDSSNVNCPTNHDVDKSECIKNQCLFDKICRQQCHLIYGGEYVPSEEYTNTCSKYSEINAIRRNVRLRRSASDNFYHGRLYEGARFQGYEASRKAEIKRLQQLKKSQHNYDNSYNHYDEDNRKYDYNSHDDYYHKDYDHHDEYNYKPHDYTYKEYYEKDYNDGYESDYFPPCKNPYGGYEYGSDGYRYGYEHGRSCLIPEDYYEVYGKDYEKDYRKDYKKDSYYEDSYEPTYQHSPDIKNSPAGDSQTCVEKKNAFLNIVKKCDSENPNPSDKAICLCKDSVVAAVEGIEEECKVIANVAELTAIKKVCSAITQ